MVAYKNEIRYPSEELKQSTAPIAISLETLGPSYDTKIPIYYAWASQDPTVGSGAGPTTTSEGWSFLEALCSSKNTKIFHDAKYNTSTLEEEQLEVEGQIEDVILALLLLNEHHREPLKKRTKNFSTPQEKLHGPLIRETQSILALYVESKLSLEENSLWELYRFEVEVAMAYKLLDKTGVAFNVEFAEEAVAKLDIATQELALQLYKAFGEVFLISSSQQLGTVLSKHFSLTERTVKGAIKTDQPTLRRFLHDPRMQTLFAWKFLAKAKSTTEGYLKRVRDDGRIHPDYRQTTLSGRCNCHDPNLTTIPKQRGRITEVEVGSPELAELCANAFREVRKAFVAAPGTLLASLDYSQVEYRIFAHYTQSARLLERLNAGEDFHDMVCQMVFGEVTKRLRHIIKIVNYGVLYGMGPGYLNKMLRIEGINPSGFMSRYESNFPEMRITQRKMMAVAEQRGYIQDVFGRRYRYIPEWGYKIVSWICQGTAANCKKKSLLRAHAIWKGRKSRVVLDIHDDLTSEVYPEDILLLPQVKLAMENFPEIHVPLKVEGMLGRNLLEMKNMDISEQSYEQILTLY